MTVHGYRGRVTQTQDQPDPARGVDVPADVFEQFVADALDSLPEQFGNAMSNVTIRVEEEADGPPLFGLYRGVPLTQRTQGSWYANPDHIVIYRRTICSRCRSYEEVERAGAQDRPPRDRPPLRDRRPASRGARVGVTGPGTTHHAALPRNGPLEFRRVGVCSRACRPRWAWI